MDFTPVPTKRKKRTVFRSVSFKMFVQISLLLLVFSLIIVTIMQVFSATFQNTRAKGSLSNVSNYVKGALDNFDRWGGDMEGAEYIDFCEQIDKIASINSNLIYIYHTIEGEEGEEVAQFFTTDRFERLEEMVVDMSAGSEGDARFYIKIYESVLYISLNVNHGKYEIEILENQTYFRETASVLSDLISVTVVLGAILSLAWSFWYSRFFTRPLTSMSKVTKSMANLDFDNRCLISSTDEFGELAASINEMSDKLKMALSELNEKNQRLTEQLEKAMKLDSMRKKFVSDVSHELKTPLSIIQGYAEGIEIWLNRNSFDQKPQKYCATIKDEAQRMNNLVLDLLNLSQYESGNYVLDKSEFDLSELVKSVVGSYSRTLDEGKIALNLNLNRVVVNADYRRIEQVLINYIVNALDYISGDKVLSISVSAVGDRARVAVENSGSSIMPEEIDKLWTAFYRIDAARNRNEGRHGLGLSIVKALIDLHGGECGAFNTENGVEFYFII